jgi:hypothetical protein
MKQVFENAPLPSLFVVQLSNSRLSDRPPTCPTDENSTLRNKVNEKIQMRIILVILLFVLGILAALAIGGGLLVLLAYGLGWLLNHIMQVEPFQATILALAGIVTFGILATRIWDAVIASSPMLQDDEYDEDDDYDDEDEDEYEYEEEPPVVINPHIPRWRQPLKQVDFSNTKPDDRCPCGSGRKYKNCHGVKQPK